MVRIEKWGERAGSYAMSAGVIASAFVFFYWYVFASSFENALWRALAVLVVSYPFILKHAVPAVFTNGIARAARTGVIFTNIASLENAARATVVVFTKTGTLTVGAPQIIDFVVFDDTLPLVEALHLAASLESKSAHPLARAIVEKGKTLPRGLATPFEYKEVAGMGVSGVVNRKHIEIGNLSFLEGLAQTVHGQDVGAGRFQHEGKTVVFMFVEKKLAALIAFSDALRPFAKEAVAALIERGKKIILLTNDNRTTAEVIARPLGITEIRKDMRGIETTVRPVALVENGNIRVDSHKITYPRDALQSVAFAFANSKKTVRIATVCIFLQFLFYALALPLIAAMPL